MNRCIAGTATRTGYFIAGLLFLSCSHLSKRNSIDTTGSDPEMSAMPLDTVKNTPYTVAAKPELFETAFFPGTKVESDSMLLRFYAVDIGKINIETGKIIACDPINLDIMKPYVQVFPIGQFPVQLAIAKFDHDERTAFARILFSDKPVVKWAFAVQPGEAQDSIFGEKLHGYSVDAGIALFMDERARTDYNIMEKDDAKLFTRVFIVGMEKHSHSSWQYNIYHFGLRNLAAFSTGVGDGHYGVYIGYDDKDQPCRLLTDFTLVDWWKK